MRKVYLSHLSIVILTTTKISADSNINWYDPGGTNSNFMKIIAILRKCILTKVITLSLRESQKHWQINISPPRTRENVFG